MDLVIVRKVPRSVPWRAGGARQVPGLGGVFSVCPQHAQGAVFCHKPSNSGDIFWKYAMQRHWAVLNSTIKSPAQNT